MKGKVYLTAGILFLSGLFLVLFSPADVSFLVMGTLGGICLFGSLVLICSVERYHLRKEEARASVQEEPLLEGTSSHVSESYHRAVYLNHENPGAVAMIEKGEEMILEGERRIREGDYYGGMKLVQEGEKRINRGQRFLKKGGGKYEEFYGKGIEHV